MTDHDLINRKFYRAGEETRFAEGGPERTPQTAHPAYTLAFRGTDFLLHRSPPFWPEAISIAGR